MYGGNNGGGAPPQWPSRKPAAKKAPALRITNISSGATELRMPCGAAKEAGSEETGRQAPSVAAARAAAAKADREPQ